MNRLPVDGPGQKYVQIAFFPGGFITLPEKTFVHPCDESVQQTVPSMAFLISHPGLSTQDKPIKMLFDLGLRSKEVSYSEMQQKHLQNRVPYSLGPSIANQLMQGGVDPLHDIQAIILSHVHYDHHGDPDDFPNSPFIVGHGSCDVLKNGLGAMASHQHFQPDLLQKVQAYELPSSASTERFHLKLNNTTVLYTQWKPVGPFSAAVDLLGDGSIYIVDSPGHLPGHLNLLCRVAPQKWVYLGGDACHDVRLLTGEKSMATWKDANGACTCIHLDKKEAESTLKRISALMTDLGSDIQVIVAHDWKWYSQHREQIFPKMIDF